ncbi:MAG: GC-type dockerin domain-anchored protein [Phycisphaerales bacterium]
MRRSIVAKSILLMAVAGAAQAQSSFKEYIRDTAQPDFYWPLENSFISDLQPSAYDRIRAKGYELDGVLPNGCPAPGTTPIDYYTPSYFPILQNHMTRVGGSSALIFGETEGDLEGATRYLKLSRTDFDDGSSFVNPLEAVGMHHKQPWTFHMVVSPDSDPGDSRTWETLLDIGNENAAQGPVQVLLQVDRDDVNAETTFRITTESQNDYYPSFDTRRSYEVVVDHDDVHFVNQRPWYQVVVQYYLENGDGQGRVRMLVNTVDINPFGQLVLNQEPEVDGQSNEWRSTTTGDQLHVGRTRSGAEEFHGALHHLAFWSGLLDEDETVYTELDNLADAFLDSTSSLNASADARSELVIDWDEDPRYFIWDGPLWTGASNPSDRKIRQWDDPIWDHPFTYPIIRFQTNFPTTDNSGVRPPGYPAQTTSGPEAIAQLTADWLKFTSDNLASFTTGKDLLTDPDSVAIFWQNWGARAKNDNSSFCFYSDWGSSFSLTNNWRDTPSIWRDAASHPVLDPIGSNEAEASETSAPFYREGMSINAFNSKDIFIHLKELIDASADIPTPGRFHWDLERGSNLNLAWSASDVGWWDHSTSVSEPRSDRVADWAPPSVSMPSGNIDVLADLTAITRYDYLSPHSSYNRDLSIAFSRFAHDQYDHALGVGLLTPAIEELNPNIRFSEYKRAFRGETADEIYLSSKAASGVSDISPVWFDFSSPVLYPISGPRVIYHSLAHDDGDSPTLFQEWEDVLGLNVNTPDTYLLDDLVTPDMPNNGKHEDGGFAGATVAEVKSDARVVYVEASKFNLNATYLAGGGADGAPTAPWLPYPNWSESDFYLHQNLFDITPGNITVELNQEDIARIAVFAYRHGVREFLFWGDFNDISSQSKQQEVLEGLEYVFEAIDNLRSTIPAGETSSPDFTGPVSGSDYDAVPDGTVDFHDFQYFSKAYSAGNLEADIAGGGVNGDRPDGVVNQDDTDYFAQLYLAATSP